MSYSRTTEEDEPLANPEYSSDSRICLMAGDGETVLGVLFVTKRLPYFLTGFVESATSLATAWDSYETTERVPLPRAVGSVAACCHCRTRRCLTVVVGDE